MPCFPWTGVHKGSYTLEHFPGERGEEVKVREDFWVDSEYVVGLDRLTWKPFLQSKELVLVMFYHRAKAECEWAKKHFKKAAKITKRYNHSFAAVDCVIEPQICCEAGVTQTPIYKLYVKGLPHYTFEPREFFHQDMKKWVENLGILDDKGRVVPPVHRL